MFGGDNLKRLYGVFLLILLFLAGCSSSSVSMNGEALFKKSCASCHGQNLQGGIGPTLVKIKSKYSEADIQAIIQKGSQHMPANLLDTEESKTVAKWLLTK